MRGEKELQALEARLGGRVPAGVARLSAGDLRDLLQVIEEARHQQAQELRSAGDRAFAQIPRLLRGPIRRIMGA